MNNDISIQQRTKRFAIRVISAYVELNKKPFDDAGKVLSKQFLRCGTSIGANCAEAQFAQSRADFLSKYSIALKEASECRYWMEIMIESNFISQIKFQEMQSELYRIIKILVSTTKKLKVNK
ncbi:MAG: four helix bundle protein [Cyanobacteria bacterium J06636_27]